MCKSSVLTPLVTFYFGKPLEGFCLEVFWPCWKMLLELFPDKELQLAAAQGSAGLSNLIMKEL